MIINRIYNFVIHKKFYCKKRNSTTQKCIGGNLQEIYRTLQCPENNKKIDLAQRKKSGYHCWVFKNKTICYEKNSQKLCRD